MPSRSCEQQQIFGVGIRESVAHPCPGRAVDPDRRRRMAARSRPRNRVERRCRWRAIRRTWRTPSTPRRLAMAAASRTRRLLPMPAGPADAHDAAATADRPIQDARRCVCSSHVAPHQCRLAHAAKRSGCAADAPAAGVRGTGSSVPLMLHQLRFAQHRGVCRPAARWTRSASPRPAARPTPSAAPSRPARRWRCNPKRQNRFHRRSPARNSGPTRSCRVDAVAIACTSAASRSASC